MTKLIALPADAAPTGDDLFYMLGAPGTVPVDRKVTAADVAGSPVFLGAYGAAAAAVDAIMFVSTAGSDSNTGLSRGKAKLTIAAALAALPAGGGTVVVGAGNYGTTAALTVPVGKVLIFEAGATLVPVGNFSAILLSGVVIAPRYTGTTIDMTGISGTDRCAVLFMDNSSIADGVTITKVGAGIRGIGNVVASGSSRSGKSYYCRVSCAAGVLPHVGIGANHYIGGTDTLYGYDVIGCLVDYSTADVAITQAGINLFCEPSYYIRESKIHSNTVIMPVEPTDASDRGICIIYRRAHGVSVIGNHTRYGSMGISNDESNGATIQGNVVFGPNYAGIETPGSEDTDISGNIIDGNLVLLNGITLDGSTPCLRTKVRGNTLLNGLPTTGVALRLAQTATGSVFSDNTIDATWTTKWFPLTFGADVVVANCPGIPDQGVDDIKVGADLLLKNNKAIRALDAAGTSRRIALVSNTDTIYYGDVDNAFNANLLLAAGGGGFARVLVNGIEQFRIDDFVAAVNADLRVDTVGYGIKIKEGGGGATMGVATLVAGSKVVANTKVTANSRIYYAVQALGTITVPESIAVTARTPGTSFTLTSNAATSTSVVAWWIVEPA